VIKGWWELLRDAALLWSSRNAFQLAGALAFYTLFSAAPLLIIVVTMTGLLLGQEAVQGEISAQIAQFVGPDAAEILETAVLRSRISEAGLLPTILGVGAVLFGATTVFAQLQASLNQLWEVMPRPSRRGIVVFALSRLVSFGMVLIIGFLLLVSFLTSIAVAAVLRFWEGAMPVPPALASIVDVAISFAFAIVLFGLIFKVLPDVELAWHDMWRGALVTGILFVLGQYLISLYLTRPGIASPYGAAGSLVVLLMWVYYSALILFFGAALTRVSVRRRGGAIVPSSDAVRVRTEVVERVDPNGTTGPGGNH
jgi:membrane protein